MLRLKRSLLLIIVASGLILRLWGINFGLPYQFHQDEPIVINHAMAFGSGDLNPHFFIVPPFCSYLLFLVYSIIFLIGKLIGIFAGKASFAVQFIADPTLFYLAARFILGIIPSAVSILLVHSLYKRLFGEKGALYAAGIFAVSFLCVINGHYAYVDNMLVLFILAAHIYLVRLISKPVFRNYFLSGVFIGLGITTKYNAALLLVSLLAAHSIACLNNKKRMVVSDILNKYLLYAFCAVALIAILTNPYSILDFNFFINQLTTKIRSGYMGWSYHLSYSLVQGIGIGIAVAGILGLIAIFAKEKKRKGIFFLVFPFLFYLHLALKSQPFSRYVLALTPFLAISCAYLIFKIILPAYNKRWQQNLVYVAAVLLIIPTVIKSIKADLLFSGQDTRIMATQWVEKNLKPYTRIAVDHASFRPQIFQTKEQIFEKYVYINAEPGLGRIKDKKIGFMLEAIDHKITYQVYFLSKSGQPVEQFLSMMPNVDYDMEKLKQKAIAYVVISFNLWDKEKIRFVELLNKNASVVAEFSPYYDGKVRLLYDAVDFTASPISSKELFARQSSGPSLQIYKINHE